MDDTRRSSSARDGRLTRRAFVLGGAVVVLAGAGTGVAVRLARDVAAPAAQPDPPPPQLLAAAAREHGLIADLDATTGGSASVRTLLLRARADHAAHLAALQGALAPYATTTATGSPSPSSTVTLNASTGRIVTTGTPRTLAQLRDAETRASTFAAQAALLLDGRFAALLASIAACEASHAAVLG